MKEEEGEMRDEGNEGGISLVSGRVLMLVGYWPYCGLFKLNLVVFIYFFRSWA